MENTSTGNVGAPSIVLDYRLPSLAIRVHRKVSIHTESQDSSDKGRVFYAA